MFTELLIYALFAAALFVIAMNWCFVLASLRNRRRGIDKHYSTIAVVPQILLALAALLSAENPSSNLPASSFWIIGLADISLYALVTGLMHLCRSRTAGEGQSNKTENQDNRRQGE